MPELERNDELELAHGVRLRSSGVSATVGVVRPAPPGSGVGRGVVAGDFPADVGALFAGAGMQPVLSVPLDDLTLAPAARALTAEVPFVELSVPAPGPDEGQVVLEVDDIGLLRWHVDVDAVATATALTHGTGGVPRALAPVRPGLDQVFRIPVQQPDAGDGRRGLLGFGIRKVLHLIRFPIETAAAAAGEVAVGWWENRHRPHSLNLLTPETFADVPAPGGVDTARLAELADKPFLVLVHGTFSTVRSGFAGLARPGADGPGLAELLARYEGRVLGLDHQTLHVDPSVNARWFLERLPRDRPVTLDLLTHSRGGLVGRRISDPDLATAAGVPTPHVRRLIHVGTPNAGTVLASPQRWTTLLDVFTNLFSLLPEEVATATAETVLELVKQIATGVFQGLGGLTAMDPGNPAVAAANRQPIGGAAGFAGVVRAVASDFTPAAGDLRLRALNAIVDPFFGDGNDLVVPVRGVHAAGGYRIADPYLVPTPSPVVHTAFFADAGVRAKIGEWLPGSSAE